MARCDDVLSLLGIVKLATTEQIARMYFSNHLSPSKRASECLTSLAKQKLVEGEIIKLGRPKIWRLTKKGRDRLGISFVSLPFLTRQTNHRLAITDYYIHLCLTEKPLFFIHEYREPMENGSIFSPDAFFVWQRKAYFLEIQLTPISSVNWRKKWQVYERFYRYIEKRTFQKAKLPVAPIVHVASKQTRETIGSPTGVEVIIFSPSEGENQSLEEFI